MRIAILTSLLTGLALSLACGSASSDSADNPKAEPATPAGAIRQPNLQGGAGPDTSRPSPNLIIELTALDTRFDQPELQAPAYAQVSVIVANDDEDATHSFSLYRTPNGSEPVFVGGYIAPGEARTFTFTTPEPGLYYFRDDLMPSAFNGTLETK
jgi:hypothetical protein